jgi:glycosyltransferase 2 family protein
MSAPDDIPARKPPTGDWRWVPLKLAVSVTLLVLIFRRFSWPELRTQFEQTHVLGLLVPLGVILLSNLLGAMQWHWILRGTGVGIAFGRTLRAYLAGLFLNNFMLGSVGGDVYKIWVVGRVGGMGRVAGATIVDRMVGLSALCALASCAALFEIPRGNVPIEQAGIVLAFALLIMITAAILLHPNYGTRAARWVERLPLGGWSTRMARLLGYLGEYRDRSHLLNGAFLLSLVIQGSRVVAHFSVGLAMGWSLHAGDLGKFFLVIPILGLLIALPISVGGWGVREWAGMALFAPLGHGGEEAVTLLALTAILTLIASLFGAAALVLGHGQARATVP